MFVIGFKYPHIDWGQALYDVDLMLTKTFIELKEARDGVGYGEANLFKQIITKSDSTAQDEFGSTILSGKELRLGAIGKTLAYPSISKGEEGNLILSDEFRDEVDLALDDELRDNQLIKLDLEGGYLGLVLPPTLAMRLFKKIVYGSNLGSSRTGIDNLIFSAYIKDFNVGFNFLGGIYENPNPTDYVQATAENIKNLSPYLIK